MKVRFLVHDASLTGAPIVCLNFVKWLHDSEEDIIVTTLLYRDGPLRVQFERYGGVFILWKNSAGVANWMARRLLQVYDLCRYLVYRMVKRWDVDYINSSASVVTYSRFLKSRAKKILHIHEMWGGIRDYCGKKKLVDFSRNCSFVISASESVERDLWEYCGIKSLVIHEFVDHHFTDAAEVSLRDRLNIPGRALIIGGCGRASIRKGFDLFLELAQEVVDGRKGVYFVWIGSGTSGTIDEEVFKTIEHQGNRIFVLDETSQARSLMKDFDIFLIPSREDPFPLVAIENALNGVPIICFQNATGLSPLFKGNENLQVKFESVDQMRSAMMELLADVEIRKQRGNKFQLNAMEYITENQAPKIATLLKCLS